MVSYTRRRSMYLEKAIRLRYEGMTFQEISEIIPASSETIRRWCIKFAPELDQYIPIMNKKETPASRSEESESDNKALERRIKELEGRLREETLRADFYEEMVNVAESKFNIPIRKKAGTKR